MENSRQSSATSKGATNVEVQQYSMPLPGGHLSGQVTTTHYEGPAQVTETRTTSGYVQQGGASMTTNGYQTGSYTQTSSQGGYQSAQGGYQTSQGGYQSIQGGQHTTLVGSRPSGSFQVSGQVSGQLSGHASTQQERHISGHMSGATHTSYPSGHIVSGGMVTGEQTTSWTSGNRVVYGEEHVIGINTIQGEERIISERIVEHEIKVPKKIIREEVIEKVIIVPETITREEYIEETQMVKETIIEVARPIIQEKIVEVPEIEYRDKIVERVEKIVQEKIREVPRIEYQERVVEVPKYITQEKIVEVPEIEYRDVIIEKFVEVPEIREQVVVKEVPVPQYIDKPVAEYVNVETPYDVERNIPVPVEAVTTFEYQLAQFRPRVNKVQYPLYVPRFVEVPVSAELFDASMVAHLQAQGSKLQMLSSAQAVSLCEVENMATEFRRNDVNTLQTNMDLQSALTQAWQSNRIQMRGTNGAMVTTTSSMAGSMVSRPMMTTAMPVGTTTSMHAASYSPSTTTSRKHKKTTSSRHQH